MNADCRFYLEGASAHAPSTPAVGILVWREARVLKL